jgi:tRNA G10  N-methylase Trm11
MYTLLFISGKNWRLSLAELTAYLQARQIRFDVMYVSREFFTIQLDEQLDGMQLLI